MGRNGNSQNDFWLRTKLNIETGCIEWTERLDKDGYGIFCYINSTYRAHRMAWIFKKGSIPDYVLVCHECDNPKCVNIEHLFLGTFCDNNGDRATKGRSANTNGELNPLAIRKENEIKTIRFLYQMGIERRYIRKIFDIPESSLDQILRRLRWKKTPDFSIIEAAKIFQIFKSIFDFKNSGRSLYRFDWVKLNTTLKGVGLE